MFSTSLLTVALAFQLNAAPSAQAKAAFDRGEEALAANKLDDAIAAYREAVAATPGYAEALAGLGSVYFKQGKKDEAITQFEAAIAANPAYALAYLNLGYAARKMGDFAKAAKAYEKHTQLDPNDPDGWYGLAESYRLAGQGPKALLAYETFLAKEKRPSEQKWVDKAKASVAELKAAPPAVAIAPAPAPVVTPTPPAPTTPAAAPAPVAAPSLSQRKVAEGDSFFAQKQYREASFAYLDAANADPQSVEAEFKLGNSYAVLQYYPQAIERWRRVVQLAPDEATKESARKNISKAEAKVAEAASPPAPGAGPVADVTKLRARTAYDQGVGQFQSKDYAGSLQSLTQAIQFDPALVEAYVARGSANIGLRRYAEAAADYQYAIRLNPTMSSPLYGLAEAYRAMGRVSDARQYYEKYVASSSADVRPELQKEAKDKAARLR